MALRTLPCLFLTVHLARPKKQGIPNTHRASPFRTKVGFVAFLNDLAIKHQIAREAAYQPTHGLVGPNLGPPIPVDDTPETETRSSDCLVQAISSTEPAGCLQSKCSMLQGVLARAKELVGPLLQKKPRCLSKRSAKYKRCKLAMDQYVCQHDNYIISTLQRSTGLSNRSISWNLGFQEELASLLS